MGLPELPVDHFCGTGKGTGKTLTLVLTLALVGCVSQTYVLNGSSLTLAAFKNKSNYLGSARIVGWSAGKERPGWLEVIAACTPLTWSPFD